MRSMHAATALQLCRTVLSDSAYVLTPVAHSIMVLIRLASTLILVEED
jgi:hypothetical protein